MLMAILISFLYFYFSKNRMDVLEWAVFIFGYVLIQLFVGFMVKAIDKNMGKGLLFGAGLILLVGFSVCTAVGL